MSKFYLDIFYGMNIKQETGSVVPSRSSAMFNGISVDWLRCLVFTEVDIIFSGVYNVILYSMRGFITFIKLCIMQCMVYIENGLFSFFKVISFQIGKNSR